MPRPAPPSSVRAATADLLRAITRLVESVAASARANPAVRSALGDAKRAATATGRKIAARVKASWAKYTPAERAARIRKMLAARGLKPKRKRRGRPKSGATIVRGG